MFSNRPLRSHEHICSYLVVFFFSSRRRHTRYIGDWSSDVCSSDLGAVDSQRWERREGRRDRLFLTRTSTTRSRPRTRRLAVRRERLEGPGRGGVELGPIDLLLQPVKRLVADRALLAQPVQRQSLGRDRAQAEPVVLGRALWLLRARGHLARGEVPFAHGR